MLAMYSPVSSTKLHRENEHNQESDQASKKRRQEATETITVEACPANIVNEEWSSTSSISEVAGAATLITGNVVAAEVTPEEVLCAICMGSDGDELKLLQNHNCPVCVAGAWNVCDVCDDNLLSRSCPICNSDYSPRVLYITQGLPTFPVSPQNLADPKLIRKICAIGKLVTGSNVTVWCPAEGKMHFFLPQEFTDNNTDFRSLSVTITMSQDKIVDDKFFFTNKIWDELLKEMEEGPDNSDEILTSSDTMKRIFTALYSTGSQLLTQLQPAEWMVFDA